MIIHATSAQEPASRALPSRAPQKSSTAAPPQEKQAESAALPSRSSFAAGYGEVAQGAGAEARKLDSHSPLFIGRAPAKDEASSVAIDLDAKVAQARAKELQPLADRFAALFRERKSLRQKLSLRPADMGLHEQHALVLKEMSSVSQEVDGINKKYARIRELAHSIEQNITELRAQVRSEQLASVR